MKFNKLNNRAFTLVEGLFIVAVIGVLVIVGADVLNNRDSQSNSIAQVKSQKVIIRQWQITFNKPSGFTNFDVGAVQYSTADKTVNSPQYVQLNAGITNSIGLLYRVLPDAPTNTLSCTTYLSCANENHWQSKEVGTYLYYYMPTNSTNTANAGVGTGIISSLYDARCISDLAATAGITKECPSR
jgi:hypothetical protein